MNRLKFRIISCALIVLLTMGIIPGSLWTAMGEEEIVNLAYQKTATATFTELTASVGTVDPLNVADGDVSTRWSSFGISEDMIPAIMIDLDAVVTLSEVDILLYADEREYEFELYLTNEPIVFEGFADLDGREPIYSGAGIGSGSVPNLVPTDMSGCTVVEIDSTVEGRYLTYVGTYVSGGAHAIWELEAYGEVKQIIVHDIVSINAFKASEILVTEDISSCLPSMATVSLDNNKSTEVPIIWNLDGYTAGVAGEYTINGTLDLSELPGVSNTQELQATMTVLVIDPSEKVREVENLIAAIGELTEENYVQCLPAIQAAEQALQELISSYGEELAADVSNRDMLKTACSVIS